MLSQAILSSLQKIVGENRVLSSSEDLQHFGIDRTTNWSPNPSVIVLPGSVEEVQSIVWLANEYSLALVPSGGRTGLSGGAVAKDGEIVVVMDRLNKLFDFNPTDRTVTVG
jgi:FAD/FMN-containing dehydrogenase